MLPKSSKNQFQPIKNQKKQKIGFSAVPVQFFIFGNVGKPVSVAVP